MDTPVTLVSFITRAENRVDVLLTLASSPGTRPALQAETDIPRATLSRILADFQERELVSRDANDYRVTPLGDRIATELEALFGTVESTRALQTLAGLLPLEDLAIDFDQLAAADVTLPTQVDPLAPVDRAAAVVEDAATVRTFCYSVVHAPILAALRGVARRGQQLEGVIATGVLAVVGENPELAAAARSLFEAGSVTVFLYDEGIEPQLIIADDRAMFLVTDEEGAIRGLVETDDDAIRSWAGTFFESLKRDAVPLRQADIDELLTP